MNAIAMAHEGQWEFMIAVLETGGFVTRIDKPPAAAEPTEKQGTGQTLSPSLFKAMFAKPSA